MTARYYSQSSSSSTSGATTLSWSHWCDGTSRELVVFFTAGTSAGNVTGLTATATYNAVSMTGVLSGTTTENVTIPGTGTSAGAFMFHLANPTIGLNTITVTISVSQTIRAGSAICYTGVNGIAHATSGTTSPAANNSNTLTMTNTIGNVIVCGMAHGLTMDVPAAPLTQRSFVNASGVTSSSNIQLCDAEPTSTATGLQGLSSNSSHWTLIAIELVPAADGPMSPLLIMQAQQSTLWGQTGGTTGLAVPAGENMLPGDMIVVVVACDNNGASGVTSLGSIFDGASNAYATTVQSTYDPGAAAAGVTLGFSYAEVTTLLKFTDNITAIFGPDTASSAIQIFRLRADTGYYIRPRFRANGFGTGAGTGTPTVTSSSIDNGNIIIGALGVETNAAITADADATNGAWSAQFTSVGSTGTVATSIRLAVQYKLVTAAGAQTYNPTLTSADTMIGWIEFQPMFIQQRINQHSQAVPKAAQR